MSELHKTQLGILKKLLFAETLRYSDMKVDPEIENNTFQFHIDKMIKAGYVAKTDEGYMLTKEGKKLATHIDTDTDEIVKAKKTSVHIYCIRGEKGSEEVLFYTRLKHPFFGHQGVPAGKIRYGEEYPVAAKRELFEETGLTGEPQLIKIIHYLVKDQDTGEILDDKLFFDYFFINPSGELKGNEEGEFYWVPVSEIERKITKPFSDVKVYVDAVNDILNFNGTITFEEKDHLTKDF